LFLHIPHLPPPVADKGDDKAWRKDMKEVANVINDEISYLKSISDLPLKILHLTSWRKTVKASTSGTIQVVREQANVGCTRWRGGGV
jgi:hypothetical protein